MPAISAPPFETSIETPPRKRFTREEFDRLIDTGVFNGQRYELIDGDLIDKMGKNPPHARAVRRILKWLTGSFDGDLILAQLPIQVAGGDPEWSLPEPDLSVARESKTEHSHRHPRGDEVLLVVEVSDSRAAFDLSRKAALYAAAGVAEYWVVDLTRRMLAIHRQPDGTQYRQVQWHSEEESVSLEGRGEFVKVAELLPERS